MAPVCASAGTAGGGAGLAAGGSDLTLEASVELRRRRKATRSSPARSSNPTRAAVITTGLAELPESWAAVRGTGARAAGALTTDGGAGDVVPTGVGEWPGARRR